MRPIHRQILVHLVSIVTLGGLGQTFAQSAADETANPKAAALSWLQQYSKSQVLFHQKDLDRIRETLAKATPDEAEAWLAKTESIRAALDSPEWRETRKWFEEFLRVQAFYSDEQIDHFRSKNAEVASQSPQDFKGILQDVEQRRRDLIQGAASSARLREQKVALALAYRRDQVAARDSSRLAAAEFSPSSPARPRKQTYRPPAPLVDSVDVARWAIMRQFWRGW